MKKLVLECMMLQPLSARALQQLLGQTLAAVEAVGGLVHVAEVTPAVQAMQGNAAVRTMSQLSDTERTAMRALNACGFVALMRLNAEDMVSDFAQQDAGVLIIFHARS